MEKIEDTCRDYVNSMQARAPFSSSFSSRSSQRLQVIFTFSDDYSRTTWVAMLQKEFVALEASVKEPLKENFWKSPTEDELSAIEKNRSWSLNGEILRHKSPVSSERVCKIIWN